MTEAAPTRTVIACLRFNGAAPAPAPPVTDPLPSEQFEIELANIKRKEQEKAATEASKPKDESTFGKLSAFASKAATAVDSAYQSAHESSERKIRDMDHNSGTEKWTLAFPELAASGDKFVVHYSAAVMHAGKLVSGTIFLSEKHLCFVSDTIKDSFALATIASIQPSCALKTIDNGPPFIMPVPAPQVLPNCIQFFMSGSCKVLQFLDFDSMTSKLGQSAGTAVKGRPVDRFYNWADHGWRAATQVPVPGVEYASF